MPLRPGGIALGSRSEALRLEHAYLLVHFVHARSVRLALGGQLIAFEAQLGRVDRADHGAGLELLPFLRAERHQLAGRFGGDHDVDGLDVAVRVPAAFRRARRKRPAPPSSRVAIPIVARSAPPGQARQPAPACEVPRIRA
jgi:hypothetical protein